MYDGLGTSTTRLARLLRSLAMHRASRDDTTAYAMTKAMAHLATGDLDAALSMLEYAHRGAPSDGAIGLAIGLTRHELGDPRAADPLERMTRRSEWRDLWMALILVRLRFADTEQAAVGLQEMLSRIAVPGSEFDIELATMVSRLMDADGWCGLDNTGRLTVGADRIAARSDPAGRTEIPGGSCGRLKGHITFACRETGETPRASTCLADGRADRQSPRHHADYTRRRLRGSRCHFVWHPRVVQVSG